MTITERQAINTFVARYPRFDDPFDDPEYRKYERDYKWEAHCQVAAELLSDRGRRRVAKGPPTALVDTLKKLIPIKKRKPLFSPYELIALNGAFNDLRATRKFADAVLTFVDESGERAFSRLVEATGSLPADPGRARVLTWPVVTILPFLAKPECHMFLKPKQTQRIAKAFAFDLLYSASSNWATYDRLLTLSNRLLERLRHHGARDLIDVQSFIWVVGGMPYMKRSG